MMTSFARSRQILLQAIRYSVRGVSKYLLVTVPKGIHKLGKAFAFLILMTASVTLHARGYCYTVINGSGQVVARSSTSQIDLSKRISDEMNEKYPGHHFMFELEDERPELSPSNGEPSYSSLNNRNEAIVSSLLRKYDTTQINSNFSSVPGVNWQNQNVPSKNSKSPGTDVSVKAYNRADGTHVTSHTRASKGRGR